MRPRPGYVAATAQLLREEVTGTVSDPGDLDDEVGILLNALAI